MKGYTLKTFIALLLVTCSLPLLSACGFTPVYGNKSLSTTTGVAVQSGLDSIDIAIIPNREGQFLRNSLMDRFYSKGIPANPRYRLIVQPINEKIYDFDITVESETTRRQLKITSSFELIDLQTGKSVLKRSLLSTASHNVLESKFSTLVTEQSARESALHDLAQQIERHVSLFLGT